ncbi:hypothetical protein GGX14DRAFT_391624 [Mycena pura]|uniref:Zn(2)-C6 fungal-type domain-containing protein n=1 Tax=Mycena pura TaxID=153505 RepID=A0AAD6VMA8_9AGAR|nr:hypothetical protein GGX14DRAFT_391624 [Mycena pura]
MSTSSQLVPRSASHVPMRSSTACTHCRQKRVKCMTSEDPPRSPCKRCQEKNLACKYVASIRHYPITAPDTSLSSLAARGNPPAVSGELRGGCLPPPSFPGPRRPPSNNQPSITDGASRYQDLFLTPAGPPPGYMQPQYIGRHAGNPTQAHPSPYLDQTPAAHAHHHWQVAPTQPPGFSADLLTTASGPGHWQYPGASSGSQYLGSYAGGQYPSAYQGWLPTSTGLYE